MSDAKKPRRYKHASHAAWRRVDEETIILDLNSSVYYSLNDTGSFIWEKLGEGAVPALIAGALSEEFDVKPEAAARDVDQLVERLRKEELLVAA